MKKYLLSLLLIVPALAFVSCSDDDNLPKVDFDVTFENATNVDGTLYVVQGETFTVSSVTVRNLEDTKQAYVSQASYYWDYYYIGATVEPPYTFEIQLEPTTPVGKHALEIECPVYAVDKAPAFAVLAYDVQVVASADDIPAATAPAVIRTTPSMSDTGK